jgi:hypothetical protein
MNEKCYNLGIFGRQKGSVNREYGHDTQGVTGSSVGVVVDDVETDLLTPVRPSDVEVSQLAQVAQRDVTAHVGDEGRLSNWLLRSHLVVVTDDVVKDTL